MRTPDLRKNKWIIVKFGSYEQDNNTEKGKAVVRFKGGIEIEVE